MERKQRIVALAVMAASAGLGMGSMLLFTAFLFSGAWGLMDLGLGQAGAMVWNAALSLLFFVQHSVMIRRGFRARLARLAPPHYLDAIYSLASSLVLIAVVVWWQPSAVKLVELEGPARWAMRGVFLAALAGMMWGMFSLKSLEPFGCAAIKNHLAERTPPPQQLTVQGPYLWVRHPLYLVQLAMIWCCPDLTADRLLFNVLWTAWMLLGVVLEERDLAAAFGSEYRAYQKQVPMLLPWKLPAKISRVPENRIA